jgi:PPP family 3-phenylpropionic acid transporter
MKLSDSVATRLALAHAATGLIGGIATPFFSAWLGWRGLAPTQIGALLSLSMLLRVIAGPLSGIIADARNDRRSAMIVLYAAAALGYAALSFATSPTLVFVVAVTTGVVGGTVQPLLESVTMRFAHRFAFDYGRVRAPGSAVYVAINVVSGIVVALFGLGIVAPWLAVALALNTATIWLLPAPPRDREREGFRVGLDTTLRQAGELVRNATFVLFLAAASFAQASHAMYYSFGTPHWIHLGYPSWLIGLLFPLGILIEVMLFTISLRIFYAVGATRLLLWGAMGCVLRWTIMAFDPPLPLVIFAQLLHGATFALVHLGTMYFIQKAVPPRLAATAQSLFAVCCYGVVMGTATFASGFLYAQFGGRAYLLMTAIAVVSIGFGLLLQRLWHGGRLTTHPEEEDHGFI